MVASSEPVLTVDGLSRRFGESEVVRRLDLQLRPGERIAIRGPNGSGKSTVLRCVSGTLDPTAGLIRVNGSQPGTLQAQMATGTSLSQERSFYRRLSGHRNLVFFARLKLAGGRAAEKAVRALEEELELDEIARRRVDAYSTGMVQQLSLARALLGAPNLLVLDEPTRSLDDDARERLWAALDRRPGTALVLATHRQDDEDRCGARIELPT